MMYPAATAELSTKEGFTKHVRVATKSSSALVIVLSIGILLLAYNVFSTISAITSSHQTNAWSYFFEVFMSTTGKTGGTDPILVAYVWGPIIAIVVCLILLAIHAGSKGGVTDELYSGYQQRGFIAAPISLPVTFNANRNVFQLAIVAAPNVADQDVAAAAQAISGQYAAMDKPTRKQLAKYLMKHANFGQVWRDDSLLQLPAGMFFTSVTPAEAKKPQAGLRVVVVDQSGTSGKVYGTKNLPAA